MWTFVFRRQKKEVLSQLPAKLRQMVLLDPQSIVVHKDLKKASSVMNLKNLKVGFSLQKLLDRLFRSQVKYTCEM